MKKYILTILLLFSFVFSVSADSVDFFYEYGINDEVNYLRLNGNTRNLINWANGGIDNINLVDGFRLIEILGALPLAEVPGRAVYLTTEDILYLDDGTNWWGTPTYQGTPVGGDILYFDGTNWTRLAKGTTGNTLKGGTTPSWASLNLAGGAAYVTGVLPLANFATSTLVIDGDSAGGDLTGTYPNPLVNIPARYFEPDSTAIVQFDNGATLIDLSNLDNVLTPVSLAEADLIAGIVSPLCYDYKGSEADYVLVAHHALQAGMAALTMEAWVNRDTAGNIDFIICNVTNNYIQIYMDNSNIHGQIVTGDGTEAWGPLAHGLSNNGTLQNVYIVANWNNLTSADIYVNGVKIGNGDNAGNGTVNDSAAGINIGADSTNGNTFHGKIDGVRILRRKMGLAEIEERYDAFK